MTPNENVSPMETLRTLLKSYFFAIFGAAAVALGLRVFVLEAFRIPTDLMAPMLLPGDHIFVNKLAYGGKLGLSFEAPKRGDVVVFSLPSDPTKDYIKRVVALPGDRVEIRDGHLVLNGKDVSRSVGNDRLEETLGTAKYVVRWGESEDRKMVEVTVPEGHVFVLGDNRVRGQDSRNWGFLPVSALEGRASFIWFSAGNGEKDAGLFGVRWSRLMSKVR